MLYRALPDAPRFLLAGQDAVVIDKLTRRATHIDAKAAAILARCSQFRTLRDHARALISGTAPTAAALDAVMQELQPLVDAGLLVSDAALRQALQPQSEARAVPPIGLVGFPTRDRQSALLDAIRSYVAVADRGVAIAVADQSDEPIDESVSGLAKELGVDIAYLGRAARERMVSALSERGCEADIVRFAIGADEGWSSGANRNLLMLYGAGLLTLQLDDDIRCNVAPPPTPLPGGGVSSLAPPAEYWFDDAAMSAADPCELHERLLGKDPLHALESPLSLDDASGGLLALLMTRQTTIACTSFGLAGDAASATMAHLLLLDGASRERLLIDEQTYSRAFHQRMALRVARRANVSDAPFCMAYGLGLDLRTPLAPFPPRGRSGDTVFGFLLRRTHDDRLLGYLPCAIEHDAPGRTSSLDDALLELRRFDRNDLLWRMIDELGMPAGLRAVGDALHAWGAAGDDALRDHLQGVALRARARDIAALRLSLERHDHEPAYWAMDVQRTLMALLDAIVQPDLGVPRDISLQGFAAELRQLGKLLVCWPQIMEAAADLAVISSSHPW